jgi:hypothetical protein
MLDISHVGSVSVCVCVCALQRGEGLVSPSGASSHAAAASSSSAAHPFLVLHTDDGECEGGGTPPGGLAGGGGAGGFSELAANPPQRQLSGVTARSSALSPGATIATGVAVSSTIKDDVHQAMAQFFQQYAGGGSGGPVAKPLRSGSGAEENPGGRRGSDGKASSWFQWAKQNSGPIISIAGILLQILLLAILIPQMRTDITYMQGQAASVQSTVNTMQSALLAINDKVNGADTAITAFVNNLNATRAGIETFSRDTKEDLQGMQAASAQLRADFDGFRAQLDTALVAADNKSAQIQSDLLIAQGQVELTIVHLTGNSTAARLSIEQTADMFTNAATSSLQTLMATNATAVEAITATRNTFVDVTVPAIKADLQTLNQTAALSALSASLRQSNASLSVRIDELAGGTSGTVAANVNALTVRVDQMESLAGGSSALVTAVQQAQADLTSLDATLANVTAKQVVQSFATATMITVATGATGTVPLGSLPPSVSGSLNFQFAWYGDTATVNNCYVATVWCQLTDTATGSVLTPTAQSRTVIDERFYGPSLMNRMGYVRWNVLAGRAYSIACRHTNRNNDGSQTFGNIYAQATIS